MPTCSIGCTWTRETSSGVRTPAWNSSTVRTTRTSGYRIHVRVIFAGTPEFARVALERLLAAGFVVPLVLTQPDRPAGRGMKLQASPVKRFALEQGTAVAQPRSLRLDGKYPDDAQAARVAI